MEEKKYDANNNVIEEINKNGIKTLYEFDALNNVTKVQNHEDRYVSYTYDKANNLTIKNINNKYAENTYNEDGNLLSEENEYGYKSRYSYDAFGKKVEEIKPDRTSIKYTYDNLGNKLTENKNTFTYDSGNNVISSTNKEGTVKNTYDAFNNKISVTDTKGKKVSYVFNEDNKVSNMSYGGVEITYLYNEKGLLDTVKKDNSLVAKYEYNNRNEVIQLSQNNTITNTYKFDAYDELSKSSKYVSGKKVDTSYKHDVFGNQIENSSSEGKKVFKYNDKNQVESIETEKGTIKYSYDDNGNVSKKINDNGRVDLYTYDDLNQLIKLEQGQFIYEYKYDAEKERISQKWTDTKDYHYDQWYNYTEPLDVVGDKEVEDTFKNLKEQAKKKKDNGNTCTSVLSDKYDVTYFIEPEVTEYTLDRNKEYTQVLTSNDTVNVYGETLLQSGNESIITAKNESVVAKVTSQDIKKISYSDYGQTNDIKSGNGYNSETLDQTGLIYLRARYYDPSVSRFVQIDNNYDGEKQSVASQNKYVYTMNNPYKYVDRNGNWSIWGAICDFVDKAVKEVKKAVKSVVNKFTSMLGGVGKAINSFVNKVAGVVVGAVSYIFSGNGGNTPNPDGGGSKDNKPTCKSVSPQMKCPEDEKKKGNESSIIDCTKETEKINNSIISPHGTIDVVVKRSTNTVKGGYDHFVKTNTINNNLKEVYQKENSVNNAKLIVEAFGEVLALFDRTEFVGTLIAAVAGLDTEPYNGQFAIFYKAFYEMQIVNYQGIPFVFHQVKKLVAGVLDSETDTAIMTTEYEKSDDKKFVDISYDIDNYTSDAALVKFGSKYYMLRQGAFTNIKYFELSNFVYKQSSYRAKV